MGRRWVAGILLVGLLAGCTRRRRSDGYDARDSTDVERTRHDDDDTGNDVPVTVDGVPVTPDDDRASRPPLGLRLSEGHASTTPAELLALRRRHAADARRDRRRARPTARVGGSGRRRRTVQPPGRHAEAAADRRHDRHPVPAADGAGRSRRLRTPARCTSCGTSRRARSTSPRSSRVTFDQPMVAAGDARATRPVRRPGRRSPGGRRSLALDRHAHAAVRGDPRGDRSPAGGDRVPRRGARPARPPPTAPRSPRRSSWTFSTPAPQVTSFTGESDSLPLEPVFVAVFDQRVDPSAVLDTITLDAAGQPVAAPARHRGRDRRRRPGARGVRRTRCPTARSRSAPTAALPVDADLTIAIGPGTPSLEGPLTSATPSTYHGPHLRRAARRQHQLLVRAGVRAGRAVHDRVQQRPRHRSRSTPGSSPSSPRSRACASTCTATSIQIGGATAGRTTYHVTLDGSLRRRVRPDARRGHRADLRRRTGHSPRCTDCNATGSRPIRWRPLRPSRSRPSTTTTCTSRRGRCTAADLTEFRDLPRARVLRHRSG